MKIPEVRKQLSAAADDLRTGKKTPKTIAKKLDFLVTELWRRKPRRKAGAAIRTKITPELKAQIRAYVKKHPKQDQQEVGNAFNVNPGRISEIVAGFRR
jgi:hypothetical protein